MNRDLNKLTNQQLLDLRFKDLDLNLNLKNSKIFSLINVVKNELKEKGLDLNIHFWTSTEWFCPDDTLGVAIPFYLLHPRLIKLEKEMMGYAEGEESAFSLRLIRHEIGHAIDNAFNLRRIRSRSKIFGKVSLAYPNSYTYKEYSKNFVKNLDDGYAQAHPLEDFAETFAVWLDPNSNWREIYKSWPVYEKLLWLDNLMNDLKAKKPKKNVSYKEVDSLNTLHESLRSHYQKKCKKYNFSNNTYWDNYLNTIFPGTQNKNGTLAVNFIKGNRKIISQNISKETGYRQYMVDRMLKEVEKRALDLGLTLDFTQREADIIENLKYYLCKSSNNYFKDNHHLISF